MAETDRLGIDGWAALGSMTQIPHSWWAPLIRWFPPNSHLCEYGCGAGNTAFALAQASLRYKLSLMDFSKDLLQQAWQKFQMLGGPYQVDYWCFDALESPPENFPKTIDIAYSVGLLEHFSDSEIVQILKNQSQIARTVCAIVPNAHCITYQSWKKQKEDTGTWEYGCVDCATMTLTHRGWMYWWQIRNDDRILAVDPVDKSCRWEVPLQWNVYNVEDTVCRIVTDIGESQWVTRNHRVLVEQEGALVVRQAQELQGEFVLPYVDSLPGVSPYIFESCGDYAEGRWGQLLFDKLQTESDYAFEKSKAPCQVGRGAQEAQERRDVRRDQSELEGGIGTFQIPIKVPEILYSDGDGSREVSTNGKRKELRSRASVNLRGGNQSPSASARNCASHKPRSNRQRSTQSDVVCFEQRPHTVRERLQYSPAMGRIELEPYRGVVYCPTVSTGCFVARRGSRAFITGNSEYPKNLEQMTAYFDAAGIDVVAHTTMGDNFIDEGTDERYLLAVLGNVR